MTPAHCDRFMAQPDPPPEDEVERHRCSTGVGQRCKITAPPGGWVSIPDK